MTTTAEPRKCLFCNRHAEPGEVLCDLCDLARVQMQGGWNVAGWMPEPVVTLPLKFEIEYKISDGTTKKVHSNNVELFPFQGAAHVFPPCKHPAGATGSDGQCQMCRQGMA